MIIKEGVLVFIAKGKRHCTTAVEKHPAVRLAVSRGDVAPIYPEEDIT